MTKKIGKMKTTTKIYIAYCVSVAIAMLICINEDFLRQGLFELLYKC